MTEPFSKLPSRRPVTTTEYVIGGQKFFVSVGTDESGNVGEIFLDTNKVGSPLRVFMHSFAIAISIGLQYGVPIEKYQETFIGTQCEPSGYVDGHEQIKKTTSIIDMIFRALSVDYPNKRRG